MNEKHNVVKVRLVCNYCDKQIAKEGTLMTDAEYHFRDICSDCREESYE